MGQSGSVMVMVLALMILLISLAGGFLYATGVFIGNSGWEETDNQVFWLAEAGMQKAVWNLKTPAGSGGQGENWPTQAVGTVTLTENLPDANNTYTMVVTYWDFALSANGSTASANSSSGVNVPSQAIDNNAVTFWESQFNPGTNNGSGNGTPQFITIALPYTLTVNKVRFIADSANTRPRDYSWQVSADNSSYTTLLPSVVGNGITDVTNTFSVVANPSAASVNFLRLRVTRSGNGGHVRVRTLEVIGRRISSTGTVVTGGNTLTRTVVQTVVTDSDGPQTEVAYKEPDWSEL